MTARPNAFGPLIAVVLVSAAVLAGCIRGSGSAFPPTPIATKEVATPTPGPSLPSQTDTAWGRVWDALPPWFPIPAGAVATETGSGPATAELQLPAGSGAAVDIAGRFRDEFQRAGFPELDLEGPLEDGSVIVSVRGACQIEVRVIPLGDVLVARVLYGAACPFE
jgi:hypothetical protein